MRCKVGDLVIVSSAGLNAFTGNLGRTGTVLEKVVGVDKLYTGGDDWWVKPSQSFLGWEMDGDRYSEGPEEVSFLDEELTPIRPGDLVEDNCTTKELEHS